jgi:hypothetical protein
MPRKSTRILGATNPHLAPEAGNAWARPKVVDAVNIGLMLLALAIASVVPLELFLFSYAVLGPLHYLTEISWLRDRRFFALRTTDWLPLVACTVLITLGDPGVIGDTAAEQLNRVQLAGVGLADILHACARDIAFVAFGMAFVFVITSTLTQRLVAIALIALAAVLFHVGSSDESAGFYYKWFAIYLPTLVHVVLFTGAFILLGALRRRSWLGHLSLFVFVSCGALALWLPNVAHGSRSPAAEAFWRGFRELSLFSLQDIMGYRPEQLVGVNVYTSDLVLRLIRFFAFAYTYHYLNWFSKTSIIQWHAVSRPRLLLVGSLWIASVALYLVNFDAGLRWLFFLSLAHVLLEFPLNHKSFLEIGSELRKRLVAT